MKTSIISIVIFFFLIPTLLYSQEKPILKPITNKNFKQWEDVFPVSQSDVLVQDFRTQNLSSKINNFLIGTLDTLSNKGMWSGPVTTFAFYGQDILMQWYVAPANMVIKAIGYKTANAAPDGSSIGVRIFKLKPWWNFQHLSDADTRHWGYYPSAGSGFNDVTPFPFEATGYWQDSSGLSCPGILDSCKWSNIDSAGYVTTPVTGQYTWVEMNARDYEPVFYKGDIVVIVFQNNSSVMQNEPNASNSVISISVNQAPAVIGYNQFKFYESGRFGLNSGTGWWSRGYDLDIVLVTDLTSDRAPVVESLTDIPDTIWNSPIDVVAVVTDDNPGGGPSGVSSVKLYYETSSAPLDSVLMTNTGGNIYSAQIPGQAGGTGVVYYIRATDVEGNVSLPFGFYYSIKNFNDFYYYIERNRIKMWLANNGDGSYDPTTTQAGFYWPIDIADTTQAIFEDGLVWGGYQDGNLKVGGSTYRHGLEAGTIISPGVPSDPNSSQYRVYRIRKGWESLPPGSLRDSLETDYNEWPCGDGAPCIGGVPEFVGDEVLWYVSNDLDASRTQGLYGSDPLGIEMQVTTFAYDSTNDLADIIFKKYKLINKSNSAITDMYLSYWSDPDLGDYADDFIGCGIGRNLGYTYNGNESDSKYGSPPPAVGYDLLQGPIVPGASTQVGVLNGSWRKGFTNLPMTSFLYCRSGDPTFYDPTLGNYSGTIGTYNLQRGLDISGNQIVNPVTSQITTYCFSGDPVTGTGWTDQSSNPSGDRRHYLSTGTFNFAPNDTQEVVIAILIDKGTSRLNSITELRNKDTFAENFYNEHLVPPRPVTFNDFYHYININKVKMWQSNNGVGSHDPIAPSTHGFYWPYDENDSTGAVYSDGLLWGGYIGGNLSVGGSTYRSGLEAGKIFSLGNSSDPDSSRYRVYRIRKGWEGLPPGPLRDSLETDYNEWPAEDGAPWIDMNGNGTFERGIDRPEFIGDEVLWFVSNDLDAERTQNLYGSNPLGLEMQVTSFAYDSTNDLADIVFKKYKLINKSGGNISDMYLSYWADPDLGNASDDFIGCDTLLNLGYTYNANEYDNNYGSPPPAIGYNLLKGPIVPGASNQYGLLNGTWRKGYKNLDMTSFDAVGIANFYDPPLGIYEGTTRTYYMMQGLDANGNQFINPHTGLVTKYCFPGDPVTGNGWTNQDNWELADKRHYISMGPFNFTDTDTQEVMLAILIDKGTDRLNSISELKNKDQFLQSFYYENFLPPIPDFEIQCNMSNQILEGAFDPLTDQLKVMANFNGWSGDVMTDADADSIYSFTLYNVSFDSLLSFKFWTTPNRWEAFPETRTVEVGESPGGYYAYFNDDSVYSPPKNIIVHYRCDMAIEVQFGRFNPATDQVKLMGYQYWWGTGVEMINNGSNVYEYTDTLSLGVNDYIPGYKFFYTPDTWEGGDNSTYQVNQGDYDFGEITLYRYFNQDELPSVEFLCDMTVQILEGNFDPTVDQVQVRGNFNGWSGTELTDPEGDWIYTNHIFNFEVDSHLVYKYWHSPEIWEGDPNREYTIIAGYQELYDYFNRDDDPTNGERLWEAQASNTTDMLMEVGFADDTKGLIVGDVGTILQTTNGGNEWIYRTSNSNQTLWSVSFIDTSNGWAIGNLGTILKTADGGRNWNTITGITSQPLREVFFVDANTGWIAGAVGTILKTSDSGISWSIQTTNTTLRFQSIYFFDTNIGWAVGEGGTIMHTIDGGQNWILQVSNTTNYLLDVHFENTTIGWVVGWNGTILRTDDGGNNWRIQDAKLPQGGNRNRLYNVWFTDTYHGWAVGYYGIIRYTTDGGENWLPQYSGTTQDLYGVMFSNRNYGWAVGSGGTILKYFNETPSDWVIELGISDAGGVDVAHQLTFGQNMNATDGIDPSLGEEELPPVPPVGAFDARFILQNPTITSRIDFRNSIKTNIDWLIKFQPGIAGYPITFSWGMTMLPTGLFYLKDVIDGSIININMREQGSYTLTNEAIVTLKIEFKKQVCSEIDINSGWNMLSIPFDMTNMAVDYIFPDATSEAFGFTNQYEVCNSFETGEGYWLRFDSPDTSQFCGIIASDSIQVQNSWNMIGTFEFDLPTSQLTSNPTGIITSRFFGFDNGYFTTTNIESGKGYWVKVNQDGILHYNRLQKISGSNRLEEESNDCGKLILSDKNNSSTTLFTSGKESNLDLLELPPLPPSGIFDVRFTTNRIAENIETSKDVLITSAQYPVIVKVDGVSARFKDKIDGNRVNKLLKSGEELSISDPAVNILEVTGELIPTCFELFQNYPNPFNPSTTIQFALPINTKVKIVVFDILGQQVKVLVEKEFDTGYHKVIFNANTYASGTYFYRIEAGNFWDVKKLILLK